MIAVIGGGPAGMMAAYSAKLHHPQKRVVLFERNKVLGKKLSLTGGGRCNVSVNADNETIVRHVVKNGRFLYSSLANFNPQSIEAFFKQYGVTLKEEDHGRLFPSSDQSQDIIAALQRAMLQVGVELQLNAYVEAVGEKWLVVSGEKLPCEAIIIATGGKALHQTGSDGAGYEFAKGLGHSITELYPQEVPLVSNDRFVQEKSLQGLSLKDVTLKVLDGKKTVAKLRHDLVFTHFGLSGPVALRASYYVTGLLNAGKKPVTLELDFGDNCQKRLVDVVGEENLHRFLVTVYETRGFNHAFVTNGGVSIKEVDPKTLRSRLVEGISFCGELLDVSAFTGGYNITAALSTGYTAGKHAL